MQPPEGEDARSYPLYILAGMLPWLLFSETVQRSASSILDQANLITKSVFPAEIIPVSVFLSQMMGHLLALALAVGATTVILNHVNVFLTLLPFYLLVTGLLAVGLGWIVASLHVYLRDTAQVVSVMMTLWFWMTPIFISPKDYPVRARFLLTINPLSYLVQGYRSMLLGAHAPNLQDLAIAGLYGVVLFFIGGLFFRHMKRGFADVL